MDAITVKNASFPLVGETQPRGSLFCQGLGRRARKEDEMTERGKEMRKHKLESKQISRRKENKEDKWEKREGEMRGGRSEEGGEKRKE